jgi:hypothetical protein
MVGEMCVSRFCDRWTSSGRRSRLLQDSDLLTNRERLRSAETITLWLGTGLAEQLMLVWVIALLRKLGADAGRCRIVQFNIERKHEVVAVGVLDPLRFRASST